MSNPSVYADMSGVYEEVEVPAVAVGERRPSSVTDRTPPHRRAAPPPPLSRRARTPSPERSEPTAAQSTSRRSRSRSPPPRPRQGPLPPPVPAMGAPSPSSASAAAHPPSPQSPAAALQMSRLRAELSESQAARTTLNSRLKILRAEVDRQQGVISELKMELLNQRSTPTGSGAGGGSSGGGGGIGSGADSVDVNRLKEQLKRAQRELAVNQSNQEAAVEELSSQHADAVRKCERYSATVSRQQKMIVDVFSQLSEALGLPVPTDSPMPLVMTATAGMAPVLRQAVSALTSMPTSPVPPASPTDTVDKLERELAEVKAALGAMEEQRDALKARLTSSDQESSEKMAQMHNTLLVVQKKALVSKAQLKEHKTAVDLLNGRVAELEAGNRALQLQLDHQELDLQTAAEHLQAQLDMVDSLQQERAAMQQSNAGLSARVEALQDEWDAALAANTRLELMVAEGNSHETLADARSAVKKAQLEADLKEEEVRQLKTSLEAVKADCETMRTALLSSHQAVKAAEADAEAYEAQLNDLRWKAMLEAGHGTGGTPGASSSPFASTAPTSSIPPAPVPAVSSTSLHAGSNMHRPSSQLRAALEARSRDTAIPPSPQSTVTSDAGMRAAVLGRNQAHKGDTKTLAMVQAALRLKKKQGMLYK